MKFAFIFFTITLLISMIFAQGNFIYFKIFTENKKGFYTKGAGKSCNDDADCGLNERCANTGKCLIFRRCFGDAECRRRNIALFH